MAELNDSPIDGESTLDLIALVKEHTNDRYEYIKEDDPALYYAYKAVEVEPWTLLYREHLVKLLLERKQHKQAIDIIDSGLKGNGAWWNGYELKSIIMKEIGDMDGSLENFSIAMNNQPSIGRACSFIETCIFFGRLDKADNIITNVQRKHPTSASMFFYKALILKMQNRIEEASQFIEQALKYDANQTKYKSLYVELLVIKKRIPEALKYIMENQAIHPDWADGYYFIGFILYQLNKLDAALECARKAYAIDQKESRILTLLLNLLKATGNLEEAALIEEHIAEIES